jgi:hypothetical protein
MSDNHDWETRIGGLLVQLSQTQAELLAHLDAKRQALLAGDMTWLNGSAERERELVQQLEALQMARQELLVDAGNAGLPNADVQVLAEQVVTVDRPQTLRAIKQARQQSRLLQHQSLTNWVAVQRTLLHLSQMIELIACGGEQRPTYDKRGHRTSSGGALVDQAI